MSSQRYASGQRYASATTFDVDDARQQLGKFVQTDKNRNETFHAALAQITDQQRSLNKLALELEDQQRSRCHYQREAKRFEDGLARLERKVQNSTFVAVLIDGDGAKFSTELLRAQEPGGREAARRLNQAVRNYLKEIDPEHGTDVTTVVVSVWANLKFLSRALYVDGAISNTNHMMEFAEGFSRSRAEFDFVNVGRGKENADNKLRKMLDFYYNNIQCKKIFFAGCHDTGYIHDLEEKRGTDEARRRIVLLETTTAEAQFRELEFPMTRFDTIFRREPLNNETKQNRALSYGSVSPTEK
ncbi:hypothetical protein KC340_g18767, partial [Hortaea werneckii]